MLTVESLRFYPSDFELREGGLIRAAWMSPRGIAQTVQHGSDAIDWPFDLTQPGEAREFYRRQCEANGGAMIAVEVIEVAGFETLGGVFKYRSPDPNSLGIYYVAILWLPFRDCWFQVNIEAVERGTTGIREAAVMMLDRDAWPTPEGEPELIPPGVDYTTFVRRKPIRSIPSDDPKYDEKFPDHPLSLVRRRMIEIIATAEFDARVARDLRPFRLKRKPWWRRG
ncbi:hypothetical protein [Paludisphaera rhizosphaerae]|uniref:hypothetical protein n=1 Tax=Paludisphaera rhizosphaerae TaxID=2711216 RepID=UPI0013ED63A9|nr:hypothetical protein [Paludisphaera rhizosphaerae]